MRRLLFAPRPYTENINICSTGRSVNILRKGTTHSTLKIYNLRGTVKNRTRYIRPPTQRSSLRGQGWPQADAYEHTSNAMRRTQMRSFYSSVTRCRVRSAAVLKMGQKKCR